jgi:hypothetical protein
MKSRNNWQPNFNLACLHLPLTDYCKRQPIANGKMAENEHIQAIQLFCGAKKSAATRLSAGGRYRIFAGRSAISSARLAVTRSAERGVKLLIPAPDFLLGSYVRRTSQVDRTGGEEVRTING